MHNPISPPQREEVAPGLVVEWVFHGQILIYTLYALAPEIIEKWREIATDIVDQWNPQQPYLCLCDLSNIDITPTVWEQLTSIVYNLPEGLSGRYALIFPRIVYTHIIRQFVRGDLRDDTLRQAVERDIFYNRSSAMVWLAKGIHE